MKGSTVFGDKEVARILREVAPNHARNLMRTTIHSIAGKIAQKAKANAPTGDTGTLKRSIKHKRRKSHPDSPTSDVIATMGRDVKDDAWYWRFVEFGRGGGSGSHLKGIVMPHAKPFFKPAAEDVRKDIKSIAREEFGKKLESAVKRELGKRSK